MFVKAEKWMCVYVKNIIRSSKLFQSGKNYIDSCLSTDGCTKNTEKKNLLNWLFWIGTMHAL